MNEQMILALCAALAGGVGAVLRHVVDHAATTWWRRLRVARSLPVGLLLVNLSGSLLLGLIVGATAEGHPVQAFIGAGFLGGYTTLSGATYQTVRLLRERQIWGAALIAFGQLGIGAFAAGFGFWLGTCVSA